MLAGNTAFKPTSYESIATVTVGSGGAASAAFTSIPGTYAHLQIRMFVKTDRSGASQDAVKIRFNSDSGTNYTYHFIYGDGSGTASEGYTSENGGRGYRASGDLNATSIFGAMVTDILDYANTNKYTTIKTLGGVDLNGSGEMWLTSSLWLNTNAITSITIVPATGPNFKQYSHFALYGIKGA